MARGGSFLGQYFSKSLLRQIRKFIKYKSLNLLNKIPQIYKIKVFKFTMKKFPNLYEMKVPKYIKKNGIKFTNEKYPNLQNKNSQIYQGKKSK